MRGKAFRDFLQAEYAHPFSGWDFSYLDGRRTEESSPWLYTELARSLLPSATSLLDLGTGGGERLLAFRDALPAHTVATEGYPPNLTLARQRLNPLGIEVFDSSGSLYEKLPFIDASFDLVLDRHTAYNTAEVARVLRPDGIFLTQQVDGRQTDLQAAFDSPAQWPFFTLDFMLQQIRDVPLKVEQAEEWTEEVTFSDVGAVVYYLKAVPWVVADFTIEQYLPQLERLQEEVEREGRLVFHQTFLLLKARKQKE